MSTKLPIDVSAESEDPHDPQCKHVDTRSDSTAPQNFPQNDDTQVTAYALAAMAVAVFVGSQLMAHASVGPIGTSDAAISLCGTVVLCWLYRQQLQGRAFITRIFADTKAKRLLASPEVLVLPLSLALLSFVPTLERDGHGLVGLALRLAIGLFVIGAVSEHGASWLAMAALVTMVFHPWDHPISIAAIFVGLALLVLGLSNLARRTSHSTSSNPPPSSVPSLLSLRRRRQQHWAATSLIAVAIGGGLLLEPNARKLSWRQSNPSDFGQRSASNASSSRNSTFTALSRSESLELAYRPTRSTDVVLRVYTYARGPVFLRTQTFDTWTGKTWIESNEPEREPSIPIGMWDARPMGVERVKAQFDLNTYDPEAAARGLVRTVVQAQTKLNGVVPVPTEALGAIWMLDGADQTNEFVSSTMFWRTDGTASSEREEGASPMYTVLHDTRSSGIIKEVNGDHPEWSSTEKISPAVRQLAEEIVGTATQSSEKVQRIRQWMTQNVAYNLTAKDPGGGTDPIDYLLFTSKEGSCTHFATATAALLRSVGVPTRIATGFVAQERPSLSQFIVRGRDAHAWAEVPLMDGDWLQVDTTIGAREVFRSSSINSARYLALFALLGVAGALVLVGVRALRRVHHRRSTPASTLFAADLARLARRLLVPVSPDCSTANLARLVDRQLAVEPLRPGHQSGPVAEAWPVGRLGAFGQQLEAATFGPVPVDLSAGPQIFKSAFGRARSQRWEKRRLRLTYLVRVRGDS